MTANTNEAYPLYSDDHPKFGKNATTALNIAAPEAALTKGNANLQGLGLEAGFAHNIATAYHAQRGAPVRKASRVGDDFQEFLARRNKRQDSQATLFDFARRPSRTNEGKFRLLVNGNEVAPDISGSKIEFGPWNGKPHSPDLSTDSSSPNFSRPLSSSRSGSLSRPDSSSRSESFSRPGSSRPTSKEGSSDENSSDLHDGGSWGEFKWRPGLTPLQPVFGQHSRLDSEATLVDQRSWQRPGSRSGSMVQEVLRRKSSQGLMHGIRLLEEAIPQVPQIPQIRDPELKPPRLRQPSESYRTLESLVETSSLESINSLTLKDRGLLVGGVKPLETDEIQDDMVTEPQLAVAEPEIITQEPKNTHQEHAIPTINEAFTDKQYPAIADPKDPCRNLTRMDLIKQRATFSSSVAVLNAAFVIFALTGPKAVTGRWVLAFILFIKAKDCLASLLGMFSVSRRAILNHYYPPPPVESKWILSLIPAYSEEEEMIKNCVFSLRDNEADPHKQVMVIVLDGQPRNITQYMRVTHSFRRHYVTSRFKRNELIINAGFMEDVPVICFEKTKNSGKKDSLILCHDLFNVMRENAPLYTRLLREELETQVLPVLLGKDFPGFDMVFCTDADSTIHKGAIAGLADAIARDPKAIASCGLVLVEVESGAEWSIWNMYQQFQYNFGQFVRRQAEDIWGKVTCLPGCITMIAVRPEMAGAITKYAAPVTSYPVLRHQVQYLGTDRRLTYSMLSQSKELHTLFVPSAVSETVAPQSLKHYRSQRRRWGSNAYFNNYFYVGGVNMIWITRLWCSIEIIRLTLVYYRISNTIMFIYGLIHAFDIMSLVPLLVVSQLPTMWFLVNVCVNPHLRKRTNDIMIGLAINKIMGPVLSIMVFTDVVRNLGSQAWGLTHGTPVATPADVSKTELGQQATSSLEPRTNSISRLDAEEAAIGMPAGRPRTSEESEVNELDHTDPREKIVGHLAAGL